FQFQRIKGVQPSIHFSKHKKFTSYQCNNSYRKIRITQSSFNAFSRTITTTPMEKLLRKDHWKDIHNHHKFMDEIASKYDINSNDQWYDITADQLRINGGSSLLRNYYKGSLTNLLKTIYPKYPKYICIFNVRN